MPEALRALLLLPHGTAWLAAPLFRGLPAHLSSITGSIPEEKQHHRMKALKQHLSSYIFSEKFCAAKAPFRL